MSIKIYKYQPNHKFYDNWCVEYFIFDEKKTKRKKHSAPHSAPCVTYVPPPVLIVSLIQNLVAPHNPVNEIRYFFYYKAEGTFPDKQAPSYCLAYLGSKSKSRVIFPSSWLEMLVTVSVTKEHILTIYNELAKVRPAGTYQVSQNSISALFLEKPEEEC